MTASTRLITPTTPTATTPEVAAPAITPLEITPPAITPLDIAISGTLDARAGLTLREEIAPAAANGPVLVLLDVNGVDGVNPSGLAALLDLLRHLRTRGGDLRLHGASVAFDEAHTGMQLESVSRVYPSRDEAALGDFRFLPSRETRREVRRRAGLRAHLGRRLGLVRTS